MKDLKTIRLLLWGLVGLALIGLFIAHHIHNNESAAPLPVAHSTAPFTMHTQTGKVFTDKNLSGKPTMMFFGFTHCPAICPGALADMGIWLEKLGKNASRINAVFVSVDPERDTQSRMKEYLGGYDKRIIGLTGTPQETAAIAQAYGIYYKKMPAMEDGDYMVDHSASIFLYDKDRQLISTIDAAEDRDIAFAKIKKLIEAER